METRNPFAMADGVFERKQGKVPSLGSHTQCPCSMGCCWPPAPTLDFKIICSFQGKVLGRSTSLWVLLALVNEPSVSGSTFKLP